jgi:ATP adenylyltransferase
MKKNCTFCLLQKDSNILWQNDLFYCRFDLYPVNPGHVEIIPKRHVQNIVDLSQNEWKDLQNAIKRSIAAIEKADLRKIYNSLLTKAPDNSSKWFLRNAINNSNIIRKPDAYNQGVNEGEAAGRTVDHLHWHIIPRFKADIKNPIGGIRHVIPKMGNYKIKRK